MLHFANAHPNDQSGALALLVLGSTEIDQRQFGDALRHLQAARKRLPKLADTVGYLTAVSESELRDFAATEAALQPVWQSAPPSPWVAKSVILEANSWLQLNQAPKAAALVDQHLADLTPSSRRICYWRAPMRPRETPPRRPRIIRKSTSSIRCRRKPPTPSPLWLELSGAPAPGPAGARVQTDRWRRLHSRS